MTDDTPRNLTNKDVPFYTVNLHCYSNPMYYGYGGEFNAYMSTGDVVWLERGNLRDVQVMNQTAGSNGQVVAVATVPNAFVENALRV